MYLFDKSTIYFSFIWQLHTFMSGALIRETGFKRTLIYCQNSNKIFHFEKALWHHMLPPGANGLKQVWRSLKTLIVSISWCTHKWIFTTLSTMSLSLWPHFIQHKFALHCIQHIAILIARFMGPKWGLSQADRTQVGPMLAPWTLLSG